VPLTLALVSRGSGSIGGRKEEGKKRRMTEKENTRSNEQTEVKMGGKE
jgi:hypothetical protein